MVEGTGGVIEVSKDGESEGVMGMVQGENDGGWQ